MSFAHKWGFTKERWYGNCKKVIVYLILLAFLLCAFWGTLSGKEIVDYIEADGIEEIVIKKTLEDGNGIEDYCTFKLKSEDVRELYAMLSEMKVKNIGEKSFSINTNVRYYVYLNDANGFSKGTMKFYGDEVLIFDYVYGDRPPIHKRYSIVSSSIKDFFETRISQKEEEQT